MLEEDIQIKDFSQKNHTLEEFLKLVKEYDKKGYDFFIGTDSQVFENHISIVTAICPRKMDEGFGTSGKIFYIKNRIDPRECPSLRARMLMEAYKSIEAAMDLDSYISGKISIHLDIGTGNKSETRIYTKELQYLVTAQGYECKVKPESWAAGAVADRFSKT